MKNTTCLSLGLAFLAGLACAGARAGVVGATLVKDIDTTPGSASAQPRGFRTIDGKVYFQARRPDTGNELYVSDGVSPQAQLVVDLARGPASSNPAVLGVAGTKLILTGDDGLRGEQLWSVDLASGERTRLTSLASQLPGQPIATAVGALGGRVVYLSHPEPELWITDGTTAGTARLHAPQPYTGRDPTTCLQPQRALTLLPSGLGEYDLVAGDGTPANDVVLAHVPSLSRVRVFRDGDVCYFAGRATSEFGTIVWRSDGTVAGTALVHQAEGNLEGAALLDASLYLTERGVSEFRFVRIGDAQPLLTLPSGAQATSQLVASAGRLVLTAPFTEGFSSSSLFVSDGTAAGTQRLARPANLLGDAYSRLRRVGDRVVFQDIALATWALDPVGATFVRLDADLTSLQSGDIADLGGIALTAGRDARGDEVWRTDGTAAGTFRLHDVWPSTADAMGIRAPLALALGDTLLFAQVREPPPASTSYGLWRTDGSEAGTYALPRAAYDAENVTRLVAFGSGAAFVTEGFGQPRVRLYSTDAALGAAALRAADDHDDPHVQTAGVAAGAVVFGCDSPVLGNLCGLRSGDAQPAVIATGLHTSGATTALGQVGNAALFLIRDSQDSAHRGLWRSDGTAPGTFRLAANLAAPPSAPWQLPARRQGGRLLFHACIAGSSDCGLYASDASVLGTQRLVSVTSPVFDVAPLGGQTAILLFGNGTQLLLSDGTGAGTRVVRTFNAVEVSPMAAADGHVLFAVRSAIGTTWYASDGSTAGTRALALPPPFVAQLDRPVALDGDTVLLPCASIATGGEFCVSNADGSDVRFARDVFPGPQSSMATLLGQAGEAAYFMLDDGTHGKELWRFAALAEGLFADDFE